MQKNDYLMWFDESDSPMSEKVRKAIEYYTKKFGNPPAILETRDDIVGLQIVVRRIHLPKFHFLLGE